MIIIEVYFLWQQRELETLRTQNADLSKKLAKSTRAYQVIPSINGAATSACCLSHYRGWRYSWLLLRERNNRAKMKCKSYSSSYFRYTIKWSSNLCLCMYHTGCNRTASCIIDCSIRINDCFISDITIHVFGGALPLCFCSIPSTSLPLTPIYAVYTYSIPGVTVLRYYILNLLYSVKFFIGQNSEKFLVKNISWFCNCNLQ